MKPIIIGFSTRKSTFSWLIRALTASKVSHCYIRVPVLRPKTDLVYQASGLKVNYEPVTSFKKKNKVIAEYEISVSDEQYERAKLERLQEVGKPYSVKQLFGFLWVLALRRIGKRTRNPFSDGNHSYVCVEICANQVGISCSENMTQEDLYRWCQANGKKL